MQIHTLLSQQTLADLAQHAWNAPEGAFAEFGVYKGGSAYVLSELAKQQGRELWLFDTFTGIPYRKEIDSHQVGDFGDTSLEAVKLLVPDAHFVVGMFPASVEGLVLPPLGFVHVDADQYDSIVAACAYFPQFMVPGGVMIFDDFLCLEGATAAIRDWGQPITITKANKAMWRKP